jgi:hypothetical protein
MVFDLGTPGPSGNENDTYVAKDTIFKVNTFDLFSHLIAQAKVFLNNQCLSIPYPYSTHTLPILYPSSTQALGCF